MNICKKGFENKLNVENVNKINFKNKKDKRMERFNMNRNIKVKVDLKEIAVKIIEKEKETLNNAKNKILELEEKLKDKDEEIEYLRNTIEDLMEEESEEFEEDDDWLDELEDEECEELQEVEELAENRYNLLIKATGEVEKKDKLIKELREENMKLKMEKAAKKIQESDIKFSEDLAKYIANVGLVSLKSCLNAIDLLSDKGEK